jgi:hypothetical protein
MVVERNQSQGKFEALISQVIVSTDSNGVCQLFAGNCLESVVAMCTMTVESTHESQHHIQQWRVRRQWQAGASNVTVRKLAAVSLPVGYGGVRAQLKEMLPRFGES